MNSSSPRLWICRAPEILPTQAALLCGPLGIAPLTARILAGRGYDSVLSARTFLDSRLAELPDPFLLPDMERAAGRLAEALVRQEKIAVHGDYDVDGIAGTTLLVEVLRGLGGQVDYHIPLRLRDGYGLSGQALQAAHEAGVRVVISVDCGVSASDEAEMARSFGIDLIITDHHQPPEVLPRAFAVINPARTGHQFPDRSLAGVGVAFFLLIALRRTLRQRGFFASGEEPDLRRSLDLVALGSIADLVPLTGINRLLTRVGLTLLQGRARPGIAALAKVAGVREVTCGTVGFQLAPRLNAAGRLEDAAQGVELLLEKDAVQAEEISLKLDSFNRQRRQIETETFLQAVEQVECGGEPGWTIVLADPRWHPGVIGIVASRLVERYHRPTVLIALENGQGKGSARSIAGFHLYHALRDCAEHLLGYGGHAYAAGLTIAAGEVAPFAERLEETARREMEPQMLQPRLYQDGEILLEELTREAVQELSRLAPFGAGNPEPAFVAMGVRAQQVQIAGEKHLRFTARQGGFSLPCIAFNMAGRTAELKGEVDLLFSASLNQWRGVTSVQLSVRDIRSARGA